MDKLGNYRSLFKTFKNDKKYFLDDTHTKTNKKTFNANENAEHIMLPKDIDTMNLIQEFVGPIVDDDTDIGKITTILRVSILGKVYPICLCENTTDELYSQIQDVLYTKDLWNSQTTRFYIFFGMKPLLRGRLLKD